MEKTGAFQPDPSGKKNRSFSTGKFPIGPWSKWLYIEISAIASINIINTLVEIFVFASKLFNPKKSYM